jgi:uncharacterized RDD family membrane protein YckC
MEWFYANGGNRVGPVTPIAFETLVTDRVVHAETLVWSKGQADWLPWKQVSGETAACAASGGRYWQREMVPYEGKFISADHKEQYFQRLREGVVQPNQMTYGNFWPRAVAKLIDGIVNWVMQTVANLLLAMVFFGSFIFQPKPNNPAVTGQFLAYQGASFVVSLILGLSYYWFFLKKYGATPGKMTFEFKVVRSDGSPLTTGRIIGRYFAEALSFMILGIGYFMAAFDEERRTLHDRICDTRVIKSR